MDLLLLCIEYIPGWYGDPSDTWITILTMSSMDTLTRGSLDGMVIRGGYMDHPTNYVIHGYSDKGALWMVW